LKHIPLIARGDDIPLHIANSLKKQRIKLRQNDILVIAQSIVSKSEGRIVELADVTPSSMAVELAEKTNKDPRLVELILSESKKLVATSGNHIITETQQGFVCANAAIDQSNSLGIGRVTLLPIDPDRSAKSIRKGLQGHLGIAPSIIITDSHGRPFRNGAIGVAIGLAGINPLKSYVGKQDLYGYTLRSEVVAQADLLASAAGLVMGESNEGIPVVLIRGYPYTPTESTANQLVRSEEKDIFRVAAMKHLRPPKIRR
jgi:coenzyme F420-0:L-glutamate ligase/coenzyme F420-1:gamma-L-glutamate ligase